MLLGQSKQNAFQNAFQHAEQLQNFSFTNTEVGSQKLSILALLLAVILLVALLRSEARNRELLERWTQLKG